MLSINTFWNHRIFALVTSFLVNISFVVPILCCVSAVSVFLAPEEHSLLKNEYISSIWIEYHLDHSRRKSLITRNRYENIFNKKIIWIVKYQCIKILHFSKLVETWSAIFTRPQITHFEENISRPEF